MNVSIQLLDYNALAICTYNLSYVGAMETKLYCITGIVRGRKVSRIALLAVVREKTFAIQAISYIKIPTEIKSARKHSRNFSSADDSRYTVHNSCNMYIRDLPDMYALSPRASGIHIRQIPMPMLQLLHIKLKC